MSETLREEVRKRINEGDYFCSKELTLSMFTGKWKIVILYHLGVEGTHRYGELEHLFKKISHKTLSKQLKELISDGLVRRKVFPVTPPQVEYSMTDLGRSLLPIILLMYEWGEARIEQLKNEGQLPLE